MENIINTAKEQVGNVSFSPGLMQAGVIVVLIFFLLLVMARITRTYIGWYTSGWYIWVILGFLFAVVIEGFFVVSGSTLFTSLLGWENAPKPLQSVLDSGRGKLMNVLGAQDEVRTAGFVLSTYEKLDSTSRSEVESTICKKEQE